MKEREINMRDPFKGPSIRNRGELARELSSTYDATTVGNGLEGMIKGSKFKSWHEEVHATLAAANEERNWRKNVDSRLKRTRHIFLMMRMKKTTKTRPLL